MMSWEKQPREPREIMEASQQNGNVNGNGNGNGVLYVKVMTDEQLETLRKQIAVYSTICEQLVDMHKNLTAQQDLAGARLGNLYCDPLMTSGSHKISARQRWTPTPMQLQILEHIFEQGNGTPSKQKIKEITSELSQHGQISETNVYNWFQNRRARSKRKQQNAGSNNAESEVETEVESPKDKKTKPEEFHSQHNSSALRPLEDVCLQSAETRNLQHSLDQQTSKAETMFPSNVGLRTTRNMSPVSSSYYDDLLSNLRNDHMVGKMELPSSYFCDIGEEYNMNMSD